MPPREVNHSNRIRSKKTTSVRSLSFKDIVEFNYRNKDKDNYDKKPLVFVLSVYGKTLTGINISYLKEYIVEQLLQETNSTKLKSWPLCDKAFRTYNISNIRMAKLIEYETLTQRKLRLTSQSEIGGSMTDQPNSPSQNPSGPGGDD